MTEKGTSVKSSQSKAMFETSDFPIVCENCLGANPYVRMLRDFLGGVCKVCARPFTVYKWKTITKNRYARTEICQTCSKIRNACQSCILDLQFGLPMQIRDQIISQGPQAVQAMPESSINREWYCQRQLQLIESGDNPWNSTPSASAIISKLAQSRPFYKRSINRKCALYEKGECLRGDKCPFIHDDGGHGKRNEDSNEPGILSRFKRSGDGDQAGSSGQQQLHDDDGAYLEVLTALPGVSKMLELEKSRK